MKQSKKIIAVIMSIVLLLAAIPFTNAFASASIGSLIEGDWPAMREVIESGYCGAQGSNLTWTMYSDGELVISGSGEMKNYPWGGVESSPWYKYHDTYETGTAIKTITIAEGVTSIGYDAFDFADQRYYRVNLPKSLKVIEGYPFDWYNSRICSGRMLAFCYAGSQSDWNKIEHRLYEYAINDYDTGDYLFSYVESVYGVDYNLDYDGEYHKMFFNGDEPQTFCDFPDSQSTLAQYGEPLTVCAYCYL